MINSNYSYFQAQLTTDYSDFHDADKNNTSIFYDLLYKSEDDTIQYKI
ncbi:hypothetical protein Trichorick_00126 [Candidatus Trichorickettsia mobilis]|uniref:Uncharacterized protein n=1 Tax=Candidatus Trichorickettsia mobilis TaxID=1346319 RepID=A0ABZ0UW29_9RICK|nr:hypothetical protein [Candidatus Trichorickettsia mobilis]WPY00254.1 hypothetical protein Trichorick_00126 [Candidatus Trichorickettsia mobilis]